MRINTEKNKLVKFQKNDLRHIMKKMLNEQKEPMSSVFRHIAFLARTKYFDNNNINFINPNAFKKTVDIDANMMRKLMDGYRSPNIDKNEFIKDFIDSLWVSKIN